MGGNRHGVRDARHGVTLTLLALAFTAGGVAGCDTDDGTATSTVGSADAITAAIAWQAGEQEPVIDDDGTAQLPVIFVVADDGATIDIGVQADVAEATVDWATVRFADDIADTFDSELEGEPVRDDGAMLLIGPMPEPSRSVELGVVRYTAVDDSEPFVLEITADLRSGTIDEGDDGPTLAAYVTSVTQP